MPNIRKRDEVVVADHAGDLVSDMAAKQRLADSIGMANEDIVTEAISIIQATTSVQVRTIEVL